MNEIPVYRDILLNSDNDGIIKELLSQNRNYNTFWGSEYIIMNEKSFIDNNFDAIIELMVKSRSVLKHAQNFPPAG
jgi:hypothetical protein